MESLYKLTADYEALMEYADSTDPDDEQVFLDTLDSVLGTLDVKMDDYAVVMAHMEAREELIAKEIKRLIAKALLDIETIEDTDNMDVQAMKSLLKYKMQLIGDLESKIEALSNDLTKEKLKHHEKLDRERENFQKSLNFCREQIALKNKRIDQLLDSNTRLLEQLLACPCRNNAQ